MEKTTGFATSMPVCATSSADQLDPARACFGIERKNSARASRLIKEANDAQAIRAYDAAASRRDMKYVLGEPAEPGQPHLTDCSWNVDNRKAKNLLFLWTKPIRS